MRFILVIFTFLLLSFSCGKQKNCEGPDLDCSTIRCIAYWTYFDFRLVDKNTGADLLFGNNPRYTSGDVKLFSDAARTSPLPLEFDAAAKSVKTRNGMEEMYLEIKGTTVYKLKAEFREIDCCSGRVKNLWMDDQKICACCNDIIPLGIN